MRTCPDCQKIVSEQAINCDNCGLQLIAEPVQDSDPTSPSSTASPGTCSACGYINTPGETFCQNCGVQLPPVSSKTPLPPTPMQSVLTSERPSNQAQPEVSPAAPSAWTCVDCGHENVPGHRYCQNCGIEYSHTPGDPQAPDGSLQPPVVVDPGSVVTPVDVPPMGASPGPCPSCGQTNPPGEMFCQNCGLQVDEGLNLEGEPTPATASNPAETLVQREHSHLQSTSTAPLFCPACGIDVSDHASSHCPNCGQHLEVAGGIPTETFETYLLQTTPDVKALQTSKPGLTEIPGRLVLFSDKTEIWLPPSKPEILIGRIDPQQGSFPDIDLTDFDTDKSSVSRQHVRLIALGEGVFIEDLESTNYTFLNKAKLEPAVRYPLNDGDEIRIGGVVLIYYAS